MMDLPSKPSMIHTPPPLVVEEEAHKKMKMKEVKEEVQSLSPTVSPDPSQKDHHHPSSSSSSSAWSACFGAVFKSHIAPSSAWIPLIVFYRNKRKTMMKMMKRKTMNKKRKSSSHADIAILDDRDLKAKEKAYYDDDEEEEEADDEEEEDGIQLRDLTLVSVCPSSEFADFSNEVDRFEPTLLCSSSFSSSSSSDTNDDTDDDDDDRASSCLLFMRVRSDNTPSRCPVKVSLYAGSILISEICFTVITSMTSTAASLYRHRSATATASSSSSSSYSSPIRKQSNEHQQLSGQQHHHHHHHSSPSNTTRIARYSLEALSSWQVAFSPIAKSLFILCIYPGLSKDHHHRHHHHHDNHDVYEDEDEEEDDDPRRDASLVDESLRASMDLLLLPLGSMSIRIAHTTASTAMGGTIDLLPSRATPSQEVDSAVTHTYDKVQVMLFPGQGAASILSPEQWKQCRARFPPLDDAARSSKMAAQQQHSMLSLSLYGSAPHTGKAPPRHSSSSSSIPSHYEWLRRSGLHPRVLSSPSPSLSQQRWSFCRSSDDIATGGGNGGGDGNGDDDAVVVVASVASSIDLRTRFLSSVHSLMRSLQPYQSTTPLGLILLPTASSTASSSSTVSSSSSSRGIDRRPVEWNKAQLSSTLRALIEHRSHHHHHHDADDDDVDDDAISTQQHQHKTGSPWQLHLICQGLYPLSTAATALSLSISSLTCVLDGFEHEDEDRAVGAVGGKGRSEEQQLHQLLPLLKTVVALLIAHHLVASSSSSDIIIPAMAFPSYISGISRAFDLSSLLDLSSLYDAIELDYLSSRYHHRGKNRNRKMKKTKNGKNKSSSSSSSSPIGASSRNEPSHGRIAVPPSSPSDASSSSSSSSSTTSTHDLLRTAVMHLEEASLLIHRRGLGQSIEQLQRVLHRSAAIEAAEGQLVRYALDGAYYWTTPQRVSEGLECWGALSALLMGHPSSAVDASQSSSSSIGGGGGGGVGNTFFLGYDHLCRPNSLTSSTSVAIEGVDSIDTMLSSLQLYDSTSSVIESKHKDHHLQLTLMQVLISDIGVMDIKLAHDAAQCLMRQGCSSYPDLISLGALFCTHSDDDDGSSVHSTIALRSMLYEAGIPLFVAAKLAAHIEATLTSR